MSGNKVAPGLEQLLLDSAFFEEILGRYGYNREALIMILQDITAKYNYLPREPLKYVAEKLKIPVSQIYGAATFYKAFSLIPRGKYIINVCLGTACHVRGADKIMESIGEKINLKGGETASDLKFTLESVRCLGCCALGPVIAVNEKMHGGLDRTKALKLIEKLEQES